MKKYLSLFLVIILVLSSCGWASAEENPGNRYIFGPLSLEISDDWKESNFRAFDHFMSVELRSDEKPDNEYFEINILDTWGAMSLNGRKEPMFDPDVMDAVKMREMMDSCESEFSMSSSAEYFGVSMDEAQIVQVGDYKFRRLHIPYENTIDKNAANELFIHAALIDGYRITFESYGLKDSEMQKEFADILASLKVTILDHVIVTEEDPALAGRTVYGPLSFENFDGWTEIDYTAKDDSFELGFADTIGLDAAFKVSIEDIWFSTPLETRIDNGYYMEDRAEYESMADCIGYVQSMASDFHVDPSSVKLTTIGENEWVYLHVPAENAMNIGVPFELVMYSSFTDGYLINFAVYAEEGSSGQQAFEELLSTLKIIPLEGAL